MFNGRDGDVLFKVGPGVPSFGNPAFLSRIPGFPGVGVIFTQVAAGDTRLVGTSPGGRQISARAVRVRACGTSFNLAGFAFASPRNAPSEVATYNRYGPGDGPGRQRRGATASLFGAHRPRDLGEPGQVPGRHRRLPGRAPDRNGHGQRPDLAHLGLAWPVRPVLHTRPCAPRATAAGS